MDNLPITDKLLCPLPPYCPYISTFEEGTASEKWTKCNYLEFSLYIDQTAQFVKLASLTMYGECVMCMNILSPYNISPVQSDSKEFFIIADDDTEYTQVSVLLIVVGIFVLIIGVVGAVGALFASKAFGRIILFVVSLSSLSLPPPSMAKTKNANLGNVYNESVVRPPLISVLCCVLYSML